jgi:hypothetical protein
MILIGPHKRQRCAWCGSVLLAQDLSRMAVQGGPEEVAEMETSSWPTDKRVIVDGDPGDVIMTHTCDLPPDGGSIKDGLPDGVVSCTEETIVSTSTPLPESVTA